jgi:hypothetical protein
MVSLAPLSEETLEDRRRYLEGHLVPVACLDCLAEVKVHKQSEFHTSIQWNDEAVRHCHEIGRRSDDRLIAPKSCSRLKESIARAVLEGQIEIGGSVD